MDQIPSSIRVLTALVIVAITATLAQRKWGSKALLWVWIVSAVIIMGATVSWISYKHGLPSAQEVFQHLFIFTFSVTYLFVGIAIASGGVIWVVAVLGPRPLETPFEEENYFSFNLPTGKLEDTYGLAGIPRRYDELLTTFLTDLDTALASTPFNPYLSPPRAFLRGFRIYLPGFMRQARVFSSQFDRVPNALARDLAGAATVLLELEMVTGAQLSAIEECHRVNVRRVRERTILGWPWSKVTAVFGICSAAITLGMSMVEKIWGFKPSDLWPLFNWGTLTGADLLSNTIRGVIFCGVMLAFFFAVQFMTFSPILRRLQAFEDILTIAKAYCKGDSATSKPRPSQGCEP